MRRKWRSLSYPTVTHVSSAVTIFCHLQSWISSMVLRCYLLTSSLFIWFIAWYCNVLDRRVTHVHRPWQSTFDLWKCLPANLNVVTHEETDFIRVCSESGLHCSIVNSVKAILILADSVLFGKNLSFPISLQLSSRDSPALQHRRQCPEVQWS